MRAALAITVVIGAVSLATGGALHAVRAEDDPRRELVVATVGSVSITAAALEQRLKAVPDFQFATFGSTPEEQKRHFLDQVLIREVLLAEGARARRLEQSPEVRDRTDAALRAARLEHLKTEQTVTPEEISAFYVSNRARFDSPERIGVHRILCRTRDEAVSVIADAKKDGSLAHWSDLAREHSMDRATSFRAGTLGYLASDGSSSEASVRVDPVLYAAAARAKDGELVSEPIAEGDGFAVIWRRGTVPASHHTIDEVTSTIRQILARKKVESSVGDLLKRLRAEQGVQEQPQLIDLIEVDSGGTVLQRRRPGVVPQKPSTPPAPSSTPRGLR